MSGAREKKSVLESELPPARHRPEQRALVSECRAVGCTQRIEPTALFCETHDRMLQSDLRTILMKHYRPGKTPSKVFTVTLARAVAEILYAQTAGHRMPRPADFDFGE